MVVVGIMAVILSIAIPSVYQQMHKDSMRKAVADVLEACNAARSRAILDGTIVELSIRGDPDRVINVSSTGRSSETDTGFEPGQGGVASGGNVFSAKFSDHLTKIEAVGFKEKDAERGHDNEMICKFYPDGTCDAIKVELQSDRGEVRIITTDVITGIADVEVAR